MIYAFVSSVLADQRLGLQSLPDLRHHHHLLDSLRLGSHKLMSTQIPYALFTGLVALVIGKKGDDEVE